MTDIRESLIRLSRTFAQAGLVVAAGGNIAARIQGDELWVTPRGGSFAEIGPADLVRVGRDGHPIEGNNQPTSELALHLAAIRERPEITWTVHLHPPMANLLHALGIPIRTITTDHAYYLRSMSVVPYLHPGSGELAEAAAEELAKGADVVLLRHHGCLVVADTPELAVSRAMNLEAAAVATYRARLMGDDTTVCPPEFMEHVRTDQATATL